MGRRQKSKQLSTEATRRSRSNYRLASAQRGWLVRDVKIDGVSIVENYRRTFARVIQRQSFQSLMDKMRLQQRAIKKEILREIAGNCMDPFTYIPAVV